MFLKHASRASRFFRLWYKHMNKVDLVKRIDEKNTIVLDEENVPTIDFEELSDGPDGDENFN